MPVTSITMALLRLPRRLGITGVLRFFCG